jgi:hypothetical protein
MYEHAINSNSFHPQKEQLRTEDLINNFKFKYEELKAILDDKIKELHHTEQTYKEYIFKFQYKFDELENVNYKLRTLLLEKQSENDELTQQNLGLLKRIEQDGTSNPYIDRNGEELNYKLKNLEAVLKERDETIHNLKADFNNMNSDTWSDLNNRVDSCQKKYSLLKEKYAKLKHITNEKEDYIKVSS